MKELFCITGCYTYMHMLKIAPNLVLKFFTYFHNFMCPPPDCPPAPSDPNDNNCNSYDANTPNSAANNSANNSDYTDQDYWIKNMTDDFTNNSRNNPSSNVAIYSNGNSRGKNASWDIGPQLFISKLSPNEVFQSNSNKGQMRYLTQDSQHDPARHIKCGPVYFCFEGPTGIFSNLAQMKEFTIDSRRGGNIVVVTLRRLSVAAIEFKRGLERVLASSNLEKVSFAKDAADIIEKFNSASGNSSNVCKSSEYNMEDKCLKASDDKIYDDNNRKTDDKNSSQKSIF